MNHEEKELFLISLSQEIRSPLNGILGMTNELKKTNLNSRQLEIINNIQKASGNLLSISNSVMDLSKIETSETTIKNEDFNPYITLNEIKDSLKNQTTTNHTTLKISSEIQNNIFINLDKNKLIQIISHSLNYIIRNSYQKTVDIELNTTEKDISKFLEIKISNSNNFSPENKVDSTSNFNSINLEDNSYFNFLLPQKLTKLLRGAFNVKQNTNLEILIDIKIPYQESNNIQTQDKTQTANALKLNPNLKILIVEDNEMNIKILKNIFKRQNISCEIAINGKEALEKVKTLKRIDLILMDLQLPIMNGLEATKIIIKELTSPPPIIGLSVKTLKSEIKKCIDSGMSDYLTKPFKEEKLIELIHKHTQKSNIKKEKLFDISNLMKLSNNDMNFTKKMLTLFLKIIDDDREILELKSEFNLEEYNQFIHKLKASLHNLNATSISTLIDLYESDKIENEKDKQELRFQIKNKLIQLYGDIKSMLVLLY